jgi:glucose/mannose-6-phosphate isomerase
MEIKDYVSKYDPQNQFDVLKSSYKQIEYAWNNSIKVTSLVEKKFSSVIIAGLGGSAIAGDLVLNFLQDELKLPLIINRNYSLPSYADEKTLVIISSYSGNTEETNSVFKEASERNCSIVAVTTGGEVEKFSVENNYPLVRLQKGFQPRFALGLSFFSLLKIFQELNLIAPQDEFVTKIISLWKNLAEEYTGEENTALKYAVQLAGFIPVIYSAADITSAAGYRWKCQFNENSKLHSYSNVIPELNHNEIIGWETFSDKQFNAKLINLLDETYHPQVKKRFEITSELASLNKVEVINISSDQNDFKCRLMDLIYLGDWISFYLALLRGYDPSEIKNIDVLKERLK